VVVIIQLGVGVGEGVVVISGVGVAVGVSLGLGVGVGVQGGNVPNAELDALDDKPVELDKLDSLDDSPGLDDKLDEDDKVPPLEVAPPGTVVERPNALLLEDAPPGTVVALPDAPALGPHATSARTPTKRARTTNLLIFFSFFYFWNICHRYSSGFLLASQVLSKHWGMPTLLQ
jgi:hypothetical protein